MDPEVGLRLDRLDNMLVQLLRTCSTRAAIVELRKDNEDMRKEIGALNSEVGELRTEMHGLHDELRTEMHGIRDELRTEMHGMHDELRTEMHGLHKELRQEIQAVAQTVASIDRHFDFLVEEMGKQYSRLSIRVAAVEDDAKMNLKRPS